MSNEIYVLVAENDQEHKIGSRTVFDDGGPIVFEQYTRSADLESIKKRRDRLGKRYGKCRIARLVFVDE